MVTFYASMGSIKGLKESFYPIYIIKFIDFSRSLLLLVIRFKIETNY
jgi:hypothetical protein